MNSQKGSTRPPSDLGRALTGGDVSRSASGSFFFAGSNAAASRLRSICSVTPSSRCTSRQHASSLERMRKRAARESFHCPQPPPARGYTDCSCSRHVEQPGLTTRSRTRSKRGMTSASVEDGKQISADAGGCFWAQYIISVGSGWVGSLCSAPAPSRGGWVDALSGAQCGTRVATW